MDDLSGKGCGCVHPRPTKVTISRYIFSVFFMAGGVLSGPFGLVKFWYVSAGTVCCVMGVRGEFRSGQVRQARWVQLGNVPVS